jgi:hypothetical protein
MGCQKGLTGSPARLKKFSKQAELEAQGAREERVELNARELDEGDLFGIRAIQSGYFGGVAQSRPTSPTGSHSPQGSTSNTLLGSRPSPKLIATTPTSSVTALPLDARQPSSSPLGQDVVSLRDGSRSMAAPRRNLTPTLRLQPSEAELSGRINHDPAVNLSLDLPPTPLRPIVPRSFAGSRSPSPTSHDQASDDHYAPSALRPGRVQDSKGHPPPVSHAEIHRADVQSQAGSIVSGRSTTDDLRQDGAQSPNQGYRSPYEEDRGRPAKPPPSAQTDPLAWDEAYLPRGTPPDASPNVTRQARDAQGKGIDMATFLAESSPALKPPSQSLPASSRPPVTGGPRSFKNSINL